MIVVITTRGNGYTLKSLAKGALGVPTPKVRLVHYDSLFGAWRVPRATYIFADLERLAPWELRIAADLYRSMAEAGLRCLNDPARAMSRFELLTALHHAGVNPFSVYRADAQPRPQRFPVFIRPEDNHLAPATALYGSQDELDKALDHLRRSGVPLRGMLVVEEAAEPYREGLWAKWGTWRIGDRTTLEHIAVDGAWLVKTGDHAKVTDEIACDERNAIQSNRFANDLHAVFDVAGIEFGRADHGTVGGRTVVYEINTNPSVPAMPSNEKISFRRQTLLIARSAIADALESVDTHKGGRVAIPQTPGRRPIRWWRPGFVVPRRP